MLMSRIVKLFGVFAAVVVASFYLDAGEDEVRVPLDERERARVLQRYRDAMGGLANLNRMQNLRIEGELNFATGKSQRVTVIKKRPNKIRMTFHGEEHLTVQAFDGDLAWLMYESPERTLMLRMSGPTRDNLIANAPIENVFVNPPESDVEISVVESVLAGRIPAYLMIARFADGSRLEIAMDQAEYRERRQQFFDADGVLVSENLPSDFTTVDGVVFARKVINRGPQGPDSTFIIHSIHTNIGVLDTVFSPLLPEESAEP